jgi:recombination protein RecR
MEPHRDIEALIEAMARLPGLGPRSARRAVLHLVKRRDTQLRPLARLLDRVGETVRDCLNCGNLGGGDICAICAAEGRANGQICVVEDVSDLWAIERARIFGGRYHVLGGLLSPLDDVGPEQLRLPQLRRRVAAEGVEEVILALGATVDGQATGHYVAAELEGSGARLSGLAQGVPVGGELDYLDDGTLRAALASRRPL